MIILKEFIRLAGKPSRQRSISTVARTHMRPGMVVYDARGVRRGRVRYVERTHLVVRRRWRPDVTVPFSRVLFVDRDIVQLTPDFGRN